MPQHDAERSEPPKIGKDLEKTEADKAKDAKLLAEIEKEKSKADDKGLVSTDDWIDYDPLAEQADRLPNSVKGADGFMPNSHVTMEDGLAAQAEDEPIDEDLGGGVSDASKLTAD